MSDLKQGLFSFGSQFLQPAGKVRGCGSQMQADRSKLSLTGVGEKNGCMFVKTKTARESQRNKTPILSGSSSAPLIKCLQNVTGPKKGEVLSRPKQFKAGSWNIMERSLATEAAAWHANH